MTLQEIFESKNKTHLVIDFDQTIAKIKIDWKPWDRIMSEVLEKYGRNEEFKGETLRRKLNDLIKKYGERARAEINQKNREYEIKNANGIIPNTELVTLIREPYRSAFNESNKFKFLSTANSRKTILPYLKELGIFDKFEKIITRDDVVLLKPETEALEKIYDPKIGKEHYIYIGDSLSDKEAARVFGIDFYKVRRFWPLFFSNK